MQTVDALGVEQAGEPFTAGEAVEVGSFRRVFELAACTVAAIVAMAAGAVFGEEFGALRPGVVAQERNRAFARDASGRFSEHLDAVRVAPGLFDRCFERRLAFVFRHRQVGQQDHPAEQRKGKTDVESVPQFPSPDDRHEENNSHDHTRNDDGAPDLVAQTQQAVAGAEILQKLIQEQEIPFRPRRGVSFGRISGSRQFSAEVFASVEEPRAQDQEQNGHQHRETGDGIVEHLVGPEIFVRLAFRVFGGDAVAAKEEDVPHEERDDTRGQHAGV